METTTDIDLQRALVLLRAARGVLKKCDEGPYVEDALGTAAFYDIESFLGIDENEPVITAGRVEP